MEENMVKFSEKLKELLATAKKKKNVLEYQEISDFFNDMELDAAFAKSATGLLAAGVEVGYSADVKSGFKVGAKDGGYYISFSDADFQALIGEYLREKLYRMLFQA